MTRVFATRSIPLGLSSGVDPYLAACLALIPMLSLLLTTLALISVLDIIGFSGPDCCFDCDDGSFCIQFLFLNQKSLFLQ
jgi:hypothetical protein